VLIKRLLPFKIEMIQEQLKEMEGLSA